MYIASECSIVVLICWLVSGGLLLRSAQNQICEWRVFEETATDVDYIQLKE